ncbi:MAG TPA: enoyl-CoA hydratase/isomerase family protein [Desulfomonilaceae bacterium]|nr:enoyl-CoA hydratase/isomerase family protein [Desulfomonilaceae bacterium]
MQEPIKASVCDEIATLLFDRPKAYNAFDLETITILAEHLFNLAVDDTVRGVIISGVGTTFCSGGDLKWVKSLPEGYPAALHHLAGRLHQAVLEIRRMKKPVVAAINGVAAGAGFSLALACDFRVMAKSAVMRQAYTYYGLTIDGGGTFTLPRLVGLARAMEIAAFDRLITAEQALEWGLVTKIVEDGRALEEALTMTEELTQGSLNSFGHSKRLMTDSFSNSFETHLELERDALCSCAGHPDAEEGMTAFADKRKPVFDMTPGFRK